MSYRLRAGAQHQNETKQNETKRNETKRNPRYFSVFITMSSPSCASPLDMAGGCGRSAFFIDTAARSDKRPYFSTNSTTATLKATLLLASLAVVHRILYAKKQIKQQAWRRHLVMGCCAAFVARVLLQMLLFWHRRITWVEVVAEAGVIVPLSLLSVRARDQRVPW